MTSLVRRNSRRGAKGRDGRGDPFGRPPDRRRLVRGERPQGARGRRRNDRSLLLRTRRERIKADFFDVKRRLRGKGRLRGILRPAFPDLESKGEFLAAIRALGAAASREVAFYNWGHVRDANLEWIAEGLAALESAA